MILRLTVNLEWINKLKTSYQDKEGLVEDKGIFY
jgi:hypothetical protein